jgi:hypothetical protein
VPEAYSRVKLTTARSHRARVQVSVRTTGGQHARGACLDRLVQVYLRISTLSHPMLLILTVDLLLGRNILVHLLEVRVEISLVGRHGACGGGLVDRLLRV